MTGRDIRLAFRSLRRSPGFTLVAAASLSLGIGANATVFSVLNSLVLRRLPVPDPAALVLLRPRVNLSVWTNPQWEYLRDHAGAFDGVAASSSAAFWLDARGVRDDIAGLYVSGGYFGTLRLTPQVGRLLEPIDDRRANEPAEPVAVLSDACWRRRFGGTSDVVGQQVQLNGVAFTIAGVAPRGFAGTDVGSSFDVAIPLAAARLFRQSQGALERWNNSWLTVVARKPATRNATDVLAALESLRGSMRAATLPVDASADASARYLKAPFDIQPAANGTSALRTKYQQPLTLTMAIVGVVLLIACANVANLMLARGAARQRDLTLQVALGASRRRLLVQLLTESLVLSVGSAMLGVGLAVVAGPALVRELAAATRSPLASLDVSPSAALLAFSAACAVVTALTFGMLPAVWATRVRAIDALPGNSRSVTSRSRRFTTGSLVVLQLALSMVLLTAAGLLIRTVISLTSLPTGVDRDRLVVSTISAARTTMPLGDRTALFDRILTSARAIPGVEAVAYSDSTPIAALGSTTMTIESVSGVPIRADQPVYLRFVGPRWFETVGVPLLAGRDITEADRAESAPVAVVNQTLSRRLFRQGSAVGQTILGSKAANLPQVEIVGVVSDAIYGSLREGVPPTIYLPLAQQPFVPTLLCLNLRTNSPVSLVPVVTKMIAGVNNELTTQTRPLSDDVTKSMAPERLSALLFGFFSGLGLIVAAVGVYGVSAHAVVQRRTELAIRAALGASRRQNSALVVRRSAVLIAVGIVAGGLASQWVARALGSLLFGVTSGDALTAVLSGAFLGGLGLLAAWLPARGAVGADPIKVLREG